MNPVVHFEIPAEDKEKAKKFYTDVFGWKTNEMGSEMGSYVILQTTEVDETMRPKTPGAINGGMYQKDKERDDHPSFVISVDNIEEHIKKINDNGGKVVHGPDKIPGVGLFASFLDTEGNRLSILQPDPLMPNMQAEK